ncbi:MAG TPA: arylamine N-acetyltransferase [Phenylobacterium sp.]|nr:arylamine N-acetyltransferase [Phenylobacterium sp.]
MIDLDAYFARIGYQGPREPTLETLRALQALHPAAIPFEAIDVLLDRGIDLAPQAVDAKLITARRGGYCFEQNNLFLRVLTALGFQVEGMLGRVVWMAPPDAPIPPRTHMALKVTIDSVDWLADVGFGGAVLTAPLRWAMDEVQATPHEPFRLRDLGAEVLLETRLEDWTPVYRLSREPQHAIDYELANWFTSAHPTSRFRQVLMVARTLPQARYALLNNRLTVRGVDGTVERRELGVDEIEQALAETFGLPVEPAWRPVIERAVAASG